MRCSGTYLPDIERENRLDYPRVSDVDIGRGDNLLRVILWGFAAGLAGTGTGALLGGVLGRRLSRSLAFLLSMAAGVMLVVVFLDLLPEALEDGGLWAGMTGLAMGMLIMLFLERRLPHLHPQDPAAATSPYVRMGVLLALGIALHNLPEGVAVGAGFASSDQLGRNVALVIGIHNVPEGMAMAFPMIAGGLKMPRIFLAGLLAGAPVGIGAGVGYWFGSISEGFLAFALALAAGAMLYITCCEMLPAARECSEDSSHVYGLLVGVGLGLLLTLIPH